MSDANPVFRLYRSQATPPDVLAKHARLPPVHDSRVAKSLPRQLTSRFANQSMRWAFTTIHSIVGLDPASRAPADEVAPVLLAA